MLAAISTIATAIEQRTGFRIHEFSKLHAILFLIGIALSIAQFVMIRDFVAIIYGEEVVIIIVTASFFFGLSVGYILSLKLSDAIFRILFVASVFLHLTFPFSYRYIAAWFGAIDMGGVGFLLLLLSYAIIFNSIFACFLPRLIHLPDQSGQSEKSRLRMYYCVELLGFMTGFGIVAFSWNKPLIFLMAPYWLILGIALHSTIQKWVITGIYVTLTTCALVFLNAVDFHSTGLIYEYKHGIDHAKVLYSVNSPYQKVEVVENDEGKRFLYLDGLQNLNSTDLKSLNYYIAEVPAFLIQPKKSLLIGNGTLSSVGKVYPNSEQVTSVELDGGVLQAGKLFFTPQESLSEFDQWQLYVDDGKYFLRTHDDRYDLIVIDVPSPLTIQEAYLHTVEFYSLCNEHLTEQGVIAVQLSGPLGKNNRTPARVTAALRQVFPEVLVIYSDRADRGFAYGSRNLPFNSTDVRKQADAYDDSLKIIVPKDVNQFLTKAVPLSVNTMDLVLRRGWERFIDRYFDD